MAVGLAAGVAWFAIVFLVHFIVLWTMPPSARPRLAQFVFLFGFIGLLLSLVLLTTLFNNPSVSNGGLAFSALGASLVYGGLLTLYLPFYYSVAASLSLQTLILLSKQPTGALPAAILRKRFASRHLISERLATMSSNGFLDEREDGYSLTDKGRRTAKVFLLFKTLWRLGAGG